MGASYARADRKAMEGTSTAASSASAGPVSSVGACSRRGRCGAWAGSEHAACRGWVTVRCGLERVRWGLAAPVWGCGWGREAVPPSDLGHPCAPSPPWGNIGRATRRYRSQGRTIRNQQVTGSSPVIGSSNSATRKPNRAPDLPPGQAPFVLGERLGERVAGPIVSTLAGSGWRSAAPRRAASTCAIAATSVESDSAAYQRWVVVMSA